MEGMQENRLLTWNLNRLERILVALGALLLVLVMAVALMLWANRVQSPASAPADQVAREQNHVLSTSRDPVTAQSAYDDGLRLAEKWAPDARLWRAQATWPAGADFEAAASGWVYTFYSPSRRETALVNAAPGTVALVRTQPATAQPSLASLEEWQIDSVTAVDLLLRSGGRAFLSIHEEASMILTLRADGRLRWQASLIDESANDEGEGRELFQMEFDAGNGRLITAPLP